MLSSLDVVRALRPWLSFLSLRLLSQRRGGRVPPGVPRGGVPNPNPNPNPFAAGCCRSAGVGAFLRVFPVAASLTLTLTLTLSLRAVVAAPGWARSSGCSPWRRP
jgi:hypothetical protein